MINPGIKKYIFPGLLIFIALALLIRPDEVRSIWNVISKAAAPFFIGIILAVIIDPAVKRFEKFFCRFVKKESCARNLSIALVFILITAVITAAAVIIIPRIWDSAALFVNSIDGYYSDFRRRRTAVLDRDALGLVNILDSVISELSGSLPGLFNKTYRFTADFLGKAASVLVGAVLSVYILAEKRRLTDFFGEAAKAALSEHTYKKCARIVNAVTSCLVNFIGGQLAEAAVLGTLCFIGMVIFDFEYPLLISTIIGVTALIPVAGAIAGAIPSALVLFLAKPASALWFLVFIVILQQLENNIIYPKIVGKSVGLPPILILAAIIAGAQAAGAVGIMLGIPLISAAYMLIREEIAGHKP